MAATKKKPASKKAAEKKKSEFFPKIKSNKRNGLGTY